MPMQDDADTCARGARWGVSPWRDLAQMRDYLDGLSKRFPDWSYPVSAARYVNMLARLESVPADSPRFTRVLRIASYRTAEFHPHQLAKHCKWVYDLRVEDRDAVPYPGLSVGVAAWVKDGGVISLGLIAVVVLVAAVVVCSGSPLTGALAFLGIGSVVVGALEVQRQLLRRAFLSRVHS